MLKVFIINEKADYQQDPELKKQALIEIINDYNALFNTNHSIAQFDSYYQDIQTRIKDQKYTNQDLPHMVSDADSTSQISLDCSLLVSSPLKRAMASSTALCCERKSKISSIKTKRG
jgi:hypothetical protein